jgi:hypothetical protein
LLSIILKGGSPDWTRTGLFYPSKYMSSELGRYTRGVVVNPAICFFKADHYFPRSPLSSSTHSTPLHSTLKLINWGICNRDNNTIAKMFLISILLLSSLLAEQFSNERSWSPTQMGCSLPLYVRCSGYCPNKELIHFNSCIQGPRCFEANQSFRGYDLHIISILGGFYPEHDYYIYSAMTIFISAI